MRSGLALESRPTPAVRENLGGVAPLTRGGGRAPACRPARAKGKARACLRLALGTSASCRRTTRSVWHACLDRIRGARDLRDRASRRKASCTWRRFRLSGLRGWRSSPRSALWGSLDGSPPSATIAARAPGEPIASSTSTTASRRMARERSADDPPLAADGSSPSIRQGFALMT
jgi:hypothetical protein